MDPLNDALVVIKNAERMGKRECVVIPASKLAGRVFSVMVEQGYIKSFEYINDGKAGKYKISLKCAINDCGAVKPRYSVKSKNIEKYEARLLPAQDYGILILTTTEGVISNTKAREHGVGGKILAYVY